MEKVFENKKSMDMAGSLANELDIIEYHIKKCLSILSEDACDNNSKGYSSYNIAEQKTPIHDFLLFVKNRKLPSFPNDPQESMYYMKNVVDNFIEAYKKYLHTN